MQSLAVKYRPTVFADVVEQGAIKIILQQQLESDEIKHAYLFCGGAGTGKTTCARIFANEINAGQGNPIELDAASNNGVDDIREIIQQAKTKSLNSEYKIFIIDECHALSNSAWQAMLKIIEEPPAKSIFIFCTTDPQKIPKTIISRVQRYDFQRISQDGIKQRLIDILTEERLSDYEDGAVDYIAKIADGGMRDAITLMDKCLAYSKQLTLENVIAALGTVDYDTFFELIYKCVLDKSFSGCIEIIENVHANGKDIKQFLHSFCKVLLDINEFAVGCDWKFISVPRTRKYESDLLNITANAYFDDLILLLDTMLKLDSSIKYSEYPKFELEAALFTYILKIKEK